MTRSKTKKRRDKTPESRKESTFYAIHHPWPPNPNLELEGYQKQLAFWIATITGSEPLLAIYHKPKCWGYVIIEVLDAFRDYDRALLGEHRWSEVFKGPQDPESCSRVFYCEFDTYRACQKRGWKQITVETHWFAQWSPINKFVTYPYPPTRYCGKPRIDETYGNVCRDLPWAKFPEAAEAVARSQPPESAIPAQAGPSPVPGSAAWLDARENPQPAPPQITTTWSKGPPKAGPSQGSSQLDNAASKVEAWMQSGPPPQTTGWVFPGNSNTPAHFAPPGLGRPSPVSPTSTDDSASTSAWTGSPEPSECGTYRPDSPVTSDGGDIGATPAHTTYQASEISETPEVLVADFMGIDLKAPRYAPSEVPLDEWGAEDAPGAASAENLWGDAPADDEPLAEGENLWASYGQPTAPAPPPPLLCKVHGKICSRGICKEYAAQKRAHERKEQAEAALKELRDRKNGKGNKSSKTPSTTTSTPMSPSASTPATRESPPPDDAHSEASAADASQADKLAFKNRPARPKPVDTPWNKPTHLGNAAPTPSAAVNPAARPARGRKMNANPASPVTPATSGPSYSARPSGPASNGWGHISAGPWGGSSVGVRSVKNDDARSTGSGAWGKASAVWPTGSAAPSVTGQPPASKNGWGHISRDPWGGSSIGTPSVKDDDARSVASGQAGVAGGATGNVSPAPSAANRVPSSNGSGSGVAKGRKAKTQAPPVKKSWAEQMEDDDDGTSLSTVSNDPWA